MRRWHSAGQSQAPPIKETDGDPRTLDAGSLNWRVLPQKTRLYLAAVIAVGACATAFSFPTTYPRPALFVILLLVSCVMSGWKVNLPISLASGSTLSMSYAANLMSLLLLGPRHAVIISVAGALTQCTYKVKQPYPL